MVPHLKRHHPNISFSYTDDQACVMYFASRWLQFQIACSGMQGWEPTAKRH